LISTMERTKVPSWAQRGGESGHANRFQIDFTDGRTETVLKATDLKIPAGSRLRITCGGGGGYGPPGERAVEAVKRDLLNGMITTEHACTHYAHALD
jgi:N-methylhydantoinase B